MSWRDVILLKLFTDGTKQANTNTATWSSVPVLQFLQIACRGQWREELPPTRRGRRMGGRGRKSRFHRGISRQVGCTAVAPGSIQTPPVVSQTAGDDATSGLKAQCCLGEVQCLKKRRWERDLHLKCENIAQHLVSLVETYSFRNNSGKVFPNDCSLKAQCVKFCLLNYFLY